LRDVLGPALLACGYRRVPKTQAAWRRPVGRGTLTVTFRASSFGSAATGGNSLNAEVILIDGEAGTRRGELSRCLTQPELDELRALQGDVNARRPLTSVTVQWLPEASPVGASTRSMYEPPVPARYREGSYVGLEYYSEQDVRVFASFLARYAGEALERFATDRCPPPIIVPLADTTFRVVPPAG